MPYQNFEELKAAYDLIIDENVVPQSFHLVVPVVPLVPKVSIVLTVLIALIALAVVVENLDPFLKIPLVIVSSSDDESKEDEDGVIIDPYSDDLDFYLLLIPPHLGFLILGILKKNISFLVSISCCICVLCPYPCFLELRFIHT